MPPFNKMRNEGLLVRALCYGEDHTGKTRWVGQAAEFGFHVVFLDADNKTSVLHQLSPEAQSRISVVNIKDTYNRATAQAFLAAFYGDACFAWNEEDKEPVFHSSQLAADKPYWIVDATALNHNTLLCIDSWTKIVRSINFDYAKKKNIDLLQAAKLDNLQDYYGACGNMASRVITSTNAYDCHFILIGHSTIYEKYKTQTTAERNMKKPREVEWSQKQVISTSGPNAWGIGSEFNDILYFNCPAPSVFEIDTQNSGDRMGGCTMIAPNIYSVIRGNELTFKYYLDAGLIAPSDPNDQCAAFQYYEAGAIPADTVLHGGKLFQTNTPLEASGDGRARLQLPGKPSGLKIPGVNA